MVAENWALLHRGVKLAGWAILQAGFLAASREAARRFPDRPALAEAFAFVAGGWVLAGIALVSQIYHLNARPPNGVWLWVALVLPAAWLLERRATAAVLFAGLVAALALEVGEKDSIVHATSVESPWLWLAIPMLAGFALSFLPRPWPHLRSGVGAWTFAAGQFFLLVFGTVQELDDSRMGRAAVVAAAGLLSAVAVPRRVLPWAAQTSRLVIASTLLPWAILGDGYQKGALMDGVALGVAWIVQFVVAILLIREGARAASRTMGQPRLCRRPRRRRHALFRFLRRLPGRRRRAGPHRRRPPVHRLCAGEGPPADAARGGDGMKKLAILAAVQIGVILGWAGYHERVRASAPTFRIPLAPVDPHDVLRGRYFILNPRDGNARTGQGDTLLTEATVTTFLRGEKQFDGPALIGFCPAGDVHRVCGLQKLEGGTPRDGFWARSNVSIYPEERSVRADNSVVEPGWRVILDMDLDRFFLPDDLQLPGHENDPSWELEVSHRPGLPLLPRRLWFQGQPLESKTDLPRGFGGGEGPIEEIRHAKLGRPPPQVTSVQRSTGHPDDADDVAPLPVGDLPAGPEPFQLQEDHVLGPWDPVPARRTDGVEHFRRRSSELPAARKPLRQVAPRRGHPGWSRTARAKKRGQPRRELPAVVQLHEPEADLFIGRRGVLACERETGETDDGGRERKGEARAPRRCG